METTPQPLTDLAHVTWWQDVSAANLAAFWEQLVRPMDRRWTRWPDAWAVDPGSANPFPNSATLVHPLSTAGAADLAGRLTGFYGAAAGGPWLLWSAWPTPSLSTWGFQLVGHPPLMVRLPGGAPPPLPPELRIVEVHDAATLADAEQTLIEGYPAPELQPFRPGALWHTRILGGPLHIWVGYAGERPVTTGMAYVDERVTGVYVIATLEEARGRGYGAAITAQCMAVDPAKPAVLQASDLGQPVYRRLGFVEVARYTLWMRLR
jgi:GNAT superfamily N-acetyltransferase